MNLQDSVNDLGDVVIALESALDDAETASEGMNEVLDRARDLALAYQKQSRR